MAINQTDEQRRSRLEAKFSQLEGWDSTRIAEKESDAQRIADKIESQIDSLVKNVSLIALSNAEILELYLSISSSLEQIDAEIVARQ
jgi:hypothetical protein